ncbi:MAG: hypothetical protein ACRDSJ_03315 [Rubrobacteraceae bacterium]
MSEEKYTTINSTTGGVMTVEVGTITGELEVRAKPTPRGVEVTVRYAGARDWYTVEGSPVFETERPEDFNDRIVSRLTTPGKKEGFNEEPVSLGGILE